MRKMLGTCTVGDEDEVDKAALQQMRIDRERSEITFYCYRGPWQTRKSWQMLEMVLTNGQFVKNGKNVCTTRQHCVKCTVNEAMGR